MRIWSEAGPEGTHWVSIVVPGAGVGSAWTGTTPSLRLLTPGCNVRRSVRERIRIACETIFALIFFLTVSLGNLSHRAPLQRSAEGIATCPIEGVGMELNGTLLALAVEI